MSRKADACVLAKTNSFLNVMLLDEIINGAINVTPDAELVNSGFLAYAMVIAFMLMLAGRVSAADNAFPEGTKGWWYYRENLGHAN